MSAVLSFSTPRFDEVEEPTNSITPTKGHALLAWLAERMTALGLVSDAAVEAGDFGWYVDVDVFGEPYRIGCSRVATQDWALSVSARRSIVERLLGRRELTADNAVLRILLEILERQPDFSSVEVVVK